MFHRTLQIAALPSVASIIDTCYLLDTAGAGATDEWQLGQRAAEHNASFPVCVCDDARPDGAPHGFPPGRHPTEQGESDDNHPMSPLLRCRILYRTFGTAIFNSAAGMDPSTVELLTNPS